MFAFIQARYYVLLRAVTTKEHFNGLNLVTKCSDTAELDGHTKLDTESYTFENR